jgi:dihydrofolate reductase/drug/metabolite transporter (DMT)-like permease
MVAKIGPFLVLLAAMMWATDAPFRVHLTAELSSTFIVLAEHFVDVLIVLPLLLVSFAELKKLTWREWTAVLAIAIGGSALASVAFTQSFHYVNPSVAILLQKLQPLIAVSLAALLLRETLTKRFWLWAFVALSGAYVISFPELRPQLFPGEEFNPNTMGVVLALLAALLWGASTVLGRFVLRTLDFKLMTALRFVFAFLFLLVLAGAQGTYAEVATITATDIFFIVIIAVVSGVVSLFIYYRGLRDTKASIATLAELGFPMAAVVVNWLFLDATLSPLQLLGMAALLFAIYELGGENAESKVIVIAAIGKNRVLGKDNKLLWHIPDDLKRFKELTRGHPVIMGRKTFESILGYTGKPLPERTNIVVTRSSTLLGVNDPSVIVSDSVPAAIEKAKALDTEKVFIIGGASVYEQALPHADMLALTLIDAEAEGDAFFPPYEDQFTRKIFEENREHNGVSYRWVDLVR